MGVELIQRNAPELYGAAWFHSTPIQWSELENRVVLLHFFDTASLRGIESLLYTRLWARHYAECGFLVIGVHVPLYSFGRNQSLIENTLHRNNVWFPVVLDNDGRIAVAYDAREIPTWFLVDKEKRLRYRFTGKGNISEFERALRQLVSECGYGAELPEVLSVQYIDEHEQYHRSHTVDIALGYAFGNIGNPEGYSPESVVGYVDPLFYLPDRCYFHGKWKSEREAMRCFDEQGYCLLSYDAKDVYALVGTENGVPAEVLVEVDSRPVDELSFGRDLIRSHNETTILLVSTPRLYHVLSHPLKEEHTVKFSPSNSHIAFYSVATTTTTLADVVQLN